MQELDMNLLGFFGLQALAILTFIFLFIGAWKVVAHFQRMRDSRRRKPRHQ